MYKIMSRPSTYQTGVTEDGQQVIMGMHRFPFVLALFFQSDGSLIGIETRSLELSTEPTDWYDRQFQESLSRTLRDWQRAIRFKESTISVKPFFLEGYRVGLQELPLDCQAFLSEPEQYSEEDQQEFFKDIQQWRDDGNSVFWWSENYQLDKDGECL